MLSPDAATMSAINDHSETVPRNVICCLLALEIAEYDVRPVFDQIRSTQSFQKLLSEATAHAGPGDLISIVREDGALLSFLADPEECFAIALTIREAASTQDCYRDLPLRIGINLGRVEIAEDEFGRPYVSGEGRQDAERVMRHGPPRQISVARPFFEVLSRAAPTLSGSLEYQGVFSDTLGPPLCLYRVPPPQNIGPDEALRAVGRTARSPAAVPVLESTSPTRMEPAQLPAQERHWLRPAWLRNSLLPVLIGVVLLTPLSRSRVDVTPTVRPAAFAGTVPSSQPLATEQNGGLAATASTVPARASGSVSVESSRGRPNGDPLRQRQRSSTIAARRIAAPAGVVTQQRKVGAENATKARSDQAPPTAMVVLAVKPWGQVYVDGKEVGITPPLKRLEVAPGRRQITITNSFLPSYQIEATLAPKEQITLTHDFSCVSHREKPCRDEFTKGLDLPPRVLAVGGGQR